MISPDALFEQRPPEVIGQIDDGTWMLQRAPGEPIVYVLASADLSGRRELRVVPNGPVYRIESLLGMEGVRATIALILRDADRQAQDLRVAARADEPLWPGFDQDADIDPASPIDISALRAAARQISNYGMSWQHDERENLRDLIDGMPGRQAEDAHLKAGAVLADVLEERAAGTEEIIATMRALLLRLDERDATRALARMIEDNQTAAQRVRLITQEDGGDHRPATILVSQLGEDAPQRGPRARVRRNGWAGSGPEGWEVGGTDRAPHGTVTKAHAVGVLFLLKRPEDTAVLLGQNERRR